jgi:14-3-3 protein epsilon
MPPDCWPLRLSILSTFRLFPGQRPTIGEITEIRRKLSTELQSICQELIDLITNKLLTASGPDAPIFFEKLRADYYRYICESVDDGELVETAEQAKACYASALEIAKTSLLDIWSLF